MANNHPIFDEVFGETSKGDTPADRARTSDHIFVRGFNLVALDSPAATGRRINAIQALKICGWANLSDLPEKGSALINETADKRRHKLGAQRRREGLSFESLAQKTGLSADFIEKLETTNEVPDIHKVEILAKALGMTIIDI